MTKSEFGSKRIEGVLQDILDEYGSMIHDACKKAIDKVKDDDDWQPIAILKQAKIDCNHDGEKLLLEHRKQHFVT